MSNTEAISGKTLIVGLGKTGLSCARYLQGQGIAIAVTDSRNKPPAIASLRTEMPEVEAVLGGFDASVFAGAQRLIVSPGVPISDPLIQAALARGVPVMGDIELFSRAAKSPIVAITGSNGKSTVTTVLGEMARRAGRNAAVGGNLGEPALDLLDEGIDLYVVELSSFQLETTYSLRAKAATVLNLSPDHMDRYRNVRDYAAAKARVYQSAGVGVVNRDDPWVAAMGEAADFRIGFTLGKPQGADFGLGTHRGERWLYRGGHQPLIPASELRISGGHNLANALAALALGEAVGLPMPAMLDALRCFRGLAHRSRFVAERKGVAWYDDSKGTNVGATVAALKGLRPDSRDSRIVLIAGGQAKGADFSPLAAVVMSSARAVILIGRDAPLIDQALSGTRIPRLHAHTMEEAVGQAAAQARRGDRVLLSPACASFDMFQDFAARGESFIAAVARLPQ